jgi:hypothetical protein
LSLDHPWYCGSWSWATVIPMVLISRPS